MPGLEEEVGILLPDQSSDQALHRCSDSREGHSLAGRSREDVIGFPREDIIGFTQRNSPLVAPVLEEDGVFLPDQIFGQGFHRLAISAEGPLLH